MPDSMDECLASLAPTSQWEEECYDMGKPWHSKHWRGDNDKMTSARRTD